MYIKLLLTLAVGAAGGIVFLKLKVPAGMLVGAVTCVAFLSIATPYAVMPLWTKLVAQIITGAYIGTTISKSDFLHLPRIIGPYLVVMVSFFILNIISGLLIYWVSPLDLLTSLLCAMPGGVSDTPLIAMDMGADAAKVALMQFVRMIFGLGVLPMLIVAADRFAQRHQTADAAVACEYAAPLPSAEKVTVHHPIAALVTTLGVATAGGFFGKFLGVPAGTLVFAMLATVAFKMRYSQTHLPTWCRRFAQVISGCCIGSQITLSDILELKFMVLPIIILVVGYLANCIVVGFLLHHYFKLSRKEGMLCVSPAGATEMALISADLGVCSPDLIVIQICRLTGVMAVFPQLLSLLIAVLS